jgi:nitronate monooxygenase
MTEFKSKYPIICSPMNQVSDLNLALAVSKAGAVPSLISYCYNTVEEFLIDIESFLKETENSELIVAADDKVIVNINFLNKIKSLKVSHVMRYVNEESNVTESQKNAYYKITRHHITSSLKSKFIGLHLDKDYLLNTTDLYFLKGNEGAGRGRYSTEELFLYYKNKYPTSNLIPVGGIGSPHDVKKYIELGAVAVAIGTLFAASQESNLSLEAKQKLVNASSKNLFRFTEGKTQNALFFDKIDKEDDLNHTQSLKEGIATGTSGHVFAGKSIDYIDSIKPVSEIVEYLVSAL